MTRQMPFLLRLLCFLALLTFPYSALAAFEATLDTGIQLDHLKWSTSAPGSGPNILSELTFKSLSPMGRLTLGWSSEDRPVWVDLQYGFGKVVDGSVKDEDFELDDRQGLFSRSTHDSNDHNVQTGRFRLGYGQFGNEHFSMYPNMGFQWQFARLKIEGGRVEIPDIDVDLSGLNSVYTAQWYAFSIGTVLQYQFQQVPVLITADANFFPYAYYEGQGRWNLRRDFEQDPSFKQDAQGLGGSLEVQAQWQVRPPWQIGLGWRGQWFDADDGTTKFFLSDGQTAKIPLRSVTHYTNFFFLNLSYQW